jgi:simple sugar transport system permease protein
VSEFFTAAVLAGTVVSGIRLAVPFLLAALGETLGQRSGVLNLGVEGIMLLGAFGAYFTTLQTSSPWLGAAVGAAIGLVLGLVTAVVSVTFKADQGISGIGVYLFGLGMSALLFQELVGTPRSISSFPRVEIPLLADLPIIGPLFALNALVYAAGLLVPLLTFVINRTTYGTNIRAVGENPEAADSLGVNVSRVRYSTLMIGGLLEGLGGAALTIELGIFQQNLTAGAGFIAVALVYFGAWRPVGVLFGSLLYGIVSATVLQWKSLGLVSQNASDLMAMLPAIITIIALVAVGRRYNQPAALTQPYERGR